ncbi:hypothetical protein F4X88_02345 [Candidatus Poribacteria bacterium]|nr:hypothetical protein [Candidatus Poribacteria bacterium]MYA55111.1 hypothetical protein [Candidatus Poribacteria bacterium]
MEKTLYKSNSTGELKTVTDSRRDFLAKIGKGALLASLGMFGAGYEAVDRGLFGRGLTPIVLVEAQEAGLPKSDMLVHSQNPFNYWVFALCSATLTCRFSLRFYWV